MEESKEPEKVEPASVEEEEPPCRTEEDREVKNQFEIYFTCILNMDSNCERDLYRNHIEGSRLPLCFCKISQMTFV